MNRMLMLYQKSVFLHLLHAFWLFIKMLCYNKTKTDNQLQNYTTPQIMTLFNSWWYIHLDLMTVRLWLYTIGYTIDYLVLLYWFVILWNETQLCIIIVMLSVAFIFISLIRFCLNSNSVFHQLQWFWYTRVEDVFVFNIWTDTTYRQNCFLFHLKNCF